MFHRNILAILGLRAHQAAHRAQHAAHFGHDVAHYVYLTAVSIEAHGWYGKAALGLLAFTLLAHFCGVQVEE